MGHVPRRRVSVAVIAALASLWLVILVVPPAILLAQRAAWLAALERPEAQAGWDEFREAMRGQTGRQGPVQRKVPKSPEPPLRVWLRDYVWLAIAAWIVLGGTLGLCTGALVVGAITTPAGAASTAQNQTPRERHDKKKDDRDGKDAKQRGHEG